MSTVVAFFSFPFEKPDMELSRAPRPAPEGGGGAAAGAAPTAGGGGGGGGGGGAATGGGGGIPENK